MGSKFWWAGTILFLLAGVIHVVALSFGSVAVVQPILVTELLFTPPLSALIAKTHVCGRDWLVVIAVSVALALFLITASPEASTQIPSAAKFSLACAIFVIAIACLTIIGNRLSPGGKAASFGTATAIINWATTQIGSIAPLSIAKFLYSMMAKTSVDAIAEFLLF